MGLDLKMEGPKIKSEPWPLVTKGKRSHYPPQARALIRPGGMKKQYNLVFLAKNYQLDWHLPRFEISVLSRYRFMIYNIGTICIGNIE